MKNYGRNKMSKYTPATFQPTVRPDWAGVLSYLSDKEKSEILVALFKYPSVECKSSFWLETIKPDLDLQYQVFQESCRAKSRGVRNRWDKISITNVEDKDKISISYVIDTERERERKRETKKEITKEKTKNVWNAIAQRWGLAEIRALTDDREKKLKLRLKEQNMTLEQFFDEIRTAIEDSPFLRGKRWHEIAGHPDDSYWEDTDWRADFDFFLQPSSLQKAIEGKYADPTLRKERLKNQK